MYISIQQFRGIYDIKQQFLSMNKNAKEKNLIPDCINICIPCTKRKMKGGLTYCKHILRNKFLRFSRLKKLQSSLHNVYDKGQITRNAKFKKRQK